MTRELEGLAIGESTTLKASSARRRRLVHYAAETLGLHHVTVEGSQKGGAGAVTVARRADGAVQSSAQA